MLYNYPLTLLYWNWVFTFQKGYTIYQFSSDSMLQNDYLKVKGNWLLLWRLHLPPKVKHFLWRLLWDCLPHGSASNQRELNARVYALIWMWIRKRGLGSSRFAELYFCQNFKSWNCSSTFFGLLELISHCTKSSEVWHVSLLVYLVSP